MGIAAFRTLEAPAAVSIGAAVAVDRLDDKTIQFTGTFSANIDVEGSLDPDGVEYGVIATVSAPGLVQIPGTYRRIRLNTTSFTSGTPVAFLAGRDSRTR